MCPLFQDLRGVRHGAAEEDEEEIAVKGRNYCDYYRTPKSTKLHERSFACDGVYSFSMDDARKGTSYITLCRDLIRGEDESCELNFNQR